MALTTSAICQKVKHMGAKCMLTQLGNLPSFSRAARSCRKPLKGASPVPGPTITTGVLTCFGSLKWACRTKIGIRSPAQASNHACSMVHTRKLSCMCSSTAHRFEANHLLLKLVLWPYKSTAKEAYQGMSHMRLIKACHM